MSTNTLTSGSQLGAGQSLTSNNGIYTLTVQSNGLLVLQNVRTGQILWSVGAIGAVKPTLTMEINGDLVFTEGNPPQFVWDTGTAGYPDAYAVLENNGNLVIVDLGAYAISSLGTAQRAAVGVSSPLLEMRTALEQALTRLSIVEKAFPGSKVARSVAEVNVRDYRADAE